MPAWNVGSKVARDAIRLASLAAILLAVALPASSQSPPPASPYLGQPLPGATPRLFAPGIVNTGLMTRDSTMTPDGREFYFRVGLGGFSASAIAVTRLVGGRWSAPEIAPFSRDSRWRDLEPFISPDGRELFFTSDRPDDPAGTVHGSFGIWVAQRQGSSWGPPRRLPAAINVGDTFHATTTRDGTLYFGRDGDGSGEIWRAKRGPGGYLAPEKLGAPFNAGQGRYNPTVAADESFVILPIIGLADSLGGSDYYIVFRGKDDTWSQPINLGAPINSPADGEISARLSPDGKYLFFSSSRVQPPAPGPRTFAGLRRRMTEPGKNGEVALYWVEAPFIDGLRKKAVWKR